VAISLDPHPISPDLPYWGDVKRRFFRNKLAVAGLVVFVFLILLAIFGPFIWSGGYKNARSGFENFRLFNSKAVLGTDDLGRDMLRRTVRGLGISLRLAAAVTVAVTLLGMVLGGLAGYFGGWIDNVLGRLIDALYAVPYVIIGIAFIAIFGRSFWTVMATLVFTGWLSTARLFRASVLQVRSQDFIEAARATGAGSGRIILQHVVPNALPPVVVSIAFSIAGAILSESIYSFLAIGFIEPTPALGVMIRQARSNFQAYPHQLFVPASVLIMLTLSIVFVGDGLRDALDPKLRGAE
jgi:oligopeptide transport system permease protein